MPLLKSGDAVGIVCCSDGLHPSYKTKLTPLWNLLEDYGLHPICSEYLYAPPNCSTPSGKARADALMKFFHNPDIHAIFDLSGGDLANGILPWLDFSLIQTLRTPFFGYSDLTAVLNAIYAKTGSCSYLYQVRNLIGPDADKQQEQFYHSLFGSSSELFHAQFQFLQGHQLQGTLVGGNIRCLLKLAGTPYFPSLQDKVLFLESCSGGSRRIAAYLNQLQQMGAFNQISGLILGTFTALEGESQGPSVGELVKSIINTPELPLLLTNEIGHGSDSKCLIIGSHFELIA